MDVSAYLDEVRARQRRVWPPDIPQQVHYPLGEVPVPDHLRHWAARAPDRAAITFYGRTIDYAELDELSDRFAAWLSSVGVRSGDRVAVLLPNCPQFTIAMVATLKIGAVHVPVNPMFQHHELEHELADSAAAVLVAALDRLGPVEQVAGATSVRTILPTDPGAFLPGRPDLPVPASLRNQEAEHGRADEWWRVHRSPRAEPVRVDLDAPAALNYTGGTTGTPKGCVHTQRNMLYTAATAGAARPPRRHSGPDVCAVYVPVFWIAGEDLGILVPLVHGHTVVLFARWDADAVLAAVQHHRVTDMIGTADNYVELMRHPRFAEHDLSSLDCPRAMSFVRKLTPDLRRQWREAVGEHSVLREASYGMTETHTADTITHGFQGGDADLNSEPVFCGLPVPGTDFMVVDPSGGEPLPLGSRGEIAIRTPSLLTGYWGRPEATAEVLRDGWLHTGDIGMVDEDGCLHFLGRNKEMIKVNGMSVFPSEVETLVARHPDVLGVAVVPAPDPRCGQVPVAFVQLGQDSATSAAALAEWAGENMAAYKVPRVELVAELPMTATGKIKKGQLLERAERSGTQRSAPEGE
ncbi:AMP-binding protein [Salinifilum aidingensis]